MAVSVVTIDGKPIFRGYSSPESPPRIVGDDKKCCPCSVEVFVDLSVDECSSCDAITPPYTFHARVFIPGRDSPHDVTMYRGSSAASGNVCAEYHGTIENSCPCSPDELAYVFALISIDGMPVPALIDSYGNLQHVSGNKYELHADMKCIEPA